VFGYIKVFEEQLRIGDFHAYKGVYCGLCRRIACYSQLARMFLSFDMVFLAMLSEYENRDTYRALGRGRCIQKYMEAGEALDYWACVSTMMIYQKLLNDVQDGEKKKRVVLKMLASGYRQCCQRYPEADARICSALKEIDMLEKQQCDDPVQIASLFAAMIEQVYSRCPGLATDTPVHAHTCRIVNELAQWVYCVDFYDDAEKDQKVGQYNPLLVRLSRMGSTLEDVLQQFRPVIDRHVEELQRLCDYLPYGGFYPVISNVLHDGVIAVSARVIQGKADKAKPAPSSASSQTDKTEIQ